MSEVLAKSVKEDFLHDGSFHQAVGKGESIKYHICNTLPTIDSTTLN